MILLIDFILKLYVFLIIINYISYKNSGY